MTKPGSEPELDVVYLPLGAAAMGGAERSLLDLAGQMVQRGRRVRVLAEEALRLTAFPSIAADRNVPVQWVDWAPEKGRLHSFVAALGVFCRLRTQLVHFNIAWRRGMWTVPLAARLVSKARLLGSMRAMAGPSNLLPRTRYFGFIPSLRVYMWPDYFIGRVWANTLHKTVSINAQDYPSRMVAEYGFAAEQLHVIYNGVELPSCLPTPAEIAVERSLLGATPEDFLIVFSGRISTEKGLDLLIAALARLPKSVRLAVVGEGPQRSELETLAIKLRVMERVTFVGFTPNPYALMAAADVVAVPSVWYEAFGRVVVEAMAYGVPVVASKIGGMGELFTHGVEGLYVVPGDGSSLETALRSLAESRAKCREMGERGRKLVEQKYSLQRVVGDYLALYDEMLAASPPQAVNRFVATRRPEDQ